MFGNETKIIHISESTGLDDEVYIGRAGHGKGGYFGNPIKIGETCLVCGKTHISKGSTLSCFEKHLKNRILVDEKFRKKIKDLEGKILVCFCRDSHKCHGRILSKYAGLINL